MIAIPRNIKWPGNYFKGSFCWDNELPVLVKDATLFLDDFVCQYPALNVLELGAGSSTFYFARRTKNVFSFETEPLWYGKVGEAVVHKRLPNVHLNLGLENLKHDFLEPIFNCLSIDTAHFINRDALLVHTLQYLVKPAILVLDNYGSKRHFPLSYNLSEEEFIETNLKGDWQCQTFDHPMWTGFGTRIFYHGT
jgi:hypothetical protein